jgi:hypothetical protein
LKRLAAAPLNLQPLIVLIAGNAAIDASTAVFPQAAADPSLKPRIIVVGASYQSVSHSEAQTGLSNTGSLVDVAAPGLRVEALNEFGRIDSTLFGTSLAAPVVAGIAAELAAFDHSLSASDLKTLIVNGAINGGRTWGSVPIVNAYESLKLAAQRRGGALCGNHLYTDSNDVVVYADRGDTLFAHRDSLGYFPSGGFSARVVALHGGRVIYNDGGLGSIKYNGTSWQTDTTDTAFRTLSGEQISSYNLSTFMNHDGDSVLSVDGLFTNSVTVSIAAVNQTPQVLTTISTTGFIKDAFAAFSPTTRTAYVAIVQSVNTPADIWTDIYSVPIASGSQTATQIAHLDHTTFTEMGFSEDGSVLWSGTLYQFRPTLTMAIDFWNPNNFADGPREERASSVSGMGAGVSPERIAYPNRHTPSARGSVSRARGVVRNQPRR